MMNIFSIDVEEWFNILDIPGEIPLPEWDKQESRLVANVSKLLELLERHDMKATMFWLGYFAEKYPELVKECHNVGHEIASHGYAHVLAYKVGRQKFREDIMLGKAILEELIGQPVQGFRAAGFSTTEDTPWFFEEVRSAGYLYDSSVFPAKRGHGGIDSSPLEPFWINTSAGKLLEIPQSVIEFSGKRISLFGGGYLRLAPKCLIDYGIRQLKKNGRPFVLYVHPREIDPLHPRLKMNCIRKFKSYTNLKSTYPKLEHLCQNRKFSLMKEFLSPNK